MTSYSSNKSDSVRKLTVSISNENPVENSEKEIFTNENFVNQFQVAFNRFKQKRIDEFAEGIKETNQQFAEERRNSLNQQLTQHSQNKKNSERKEISTAQSIKNFFTKPKKEYRKIEISSPILYTADIKTDFITINPAKNVEGKAYYGEFSFPKEQPYSFVFEQEDKSEDILSSSLFNATSEESLQGSRRASLMSSFSSDSFEFIKPENITYSYGREGLKNKRSISIDSGISSLSEMSGMYESNESLDSIVSKDSAIGSEESSLKKISTGNWNNKLKKVAIPIVPILKPKVSDYNIQENANSVEEKKISIAEGVKNPKEELLSKIEQFIPKINVSSRKTVEERIKFGTLDMLKANQDQLGLKINAIDSLLKNNPLMKMDNDKSEILLVTKKDIPLLQELEHDLKKELYKVKKQQSQEEKRISIYDKQEQKSLQDKVLKNNVERIRGIISTAKLQTNLKDRYDFLLPILGNLQTNLKKSTDDKKIHPDLKEAMKELRKEKWAAHTNLWAIKPDNITKNYLPGHDLTFAEKQDIYKHKRDAAKSILSSEQVRGEDKKILNELYKHYKELVKSSDNKSKGKSNLEREFNKEFGPTYRQAQQDLEKKAIEKQFAGQNSRPSSVMSGIKVEAITNRGRA